MRRYTALAVLIAASVASLGRADLIVTGIVDPDVDFRARGIEVFIDGTVDLSTITLQRAANNGAFDENFSLSGTFSDTFVYIVNNASVFNNVFGISGANVLQSGAVTGSGNDAFRFVNSDGTIDTVGVGGSNLYQDSYLYRNNDTGPDGDFINANWMIPGNNTLDDLSGAATDAAVPFGTFTIAAIPEPTAFAFGSLVAGGVGAVAIRRRKPGAAE